MSRADPSRVTVITGCSSGIGLACAVAFAQAGDQVIATVRDTDRAGPLREALRRANSTAQMATLDVCDDASVSGAVEQIMGEHGRVDVLVNNAGLGLGGTLEQVSIDEMRAVMEVNFFGVARVTKAVLPSMRRAGGGRVIAISSIAGAFGQPFNDGYCASKFALEGMFESLQPVAAASGVRLSLIEPGPVAGEFRERARGVEGRATVGPYAEQWKAFLSVTDAGYDGAETPADVADLVVRVAGEAEPKLRYQTTESTARLIAYKVADLDGTRVTKMTRRWLGRP